MSCLRLSILISLLFLCLIPPSFAANERGIALKPIAPTGEQVQGDTWLFVIGIDSYLSWPHLSTAVNDAKKVRDVLLERYHFDKERLIELYDTDATRKNIMGGFVRLAKNVKPEDSVLIFYAGHGHIDPITKAGSWVPVESATDDPAAWVKNNDIKDYLNANAVQAKHILLVSDSCFAGDFFRGARGALPEVNDAVVKKAYQLSSRQALTSGGVEPVTDSGFGGNSVFSHFLVAALKDNTKPFLIPSDLFPQVKAGVAQNAEQFPQLGGLYGVGGQEGGEFVFFLKQDLSDPNKLAEMDAAEKARLAELDRLRQMESDSAAAKAREQQEIAEKQRQLDGLDQQIAVLKQRLGSGLSAGPNEGLQTMLTMVRQKEEQAQKLEVLRKERLAEEMKRQAEIDKMRAEAWRNRRAAIAVDVAAYQEIANSSYGKEMAGTAWQSLVVKYPAVAEIKQGDMFALERVLDIQRFKDNDDGTVCDRQTGLTWLKNANCIDKMLWHDAMEAAANLASGKCGLTDGTVPGQWRLPRLEELTSLLDMKFEDGRNQEKPALPAGHPFIDVRYDYWTSTTEGRNYAIAVNIHNGNTYSHSLDSYSYKHERFWPVRGGK